jgi:hypothetical protein
MRQADWFINVLWTGYNFTEPFSIFRSLHLNHDVYTVSDFGGNLLNAGYEWNVNANLKNFWNAGIGGGYEFLSTSNTILRGGPSMHLPSGWRMHSRVSSDSRKKLSGSIRSNVNVKAEDVSRSYSFGASLTIRPANTLRISISPDYSSRSDEFQYVAQRNTMIRKDICLEKLTRKCSVCLSG